MALTVRVVCLTISRLCGLSARASVIQHTIASTSCVTWGWLCGRQIMSPRETYRSSVSSNVTDIGENAWGTGPAGRQVRHLVAGLEDAAGYLPGIAPVVMQLRVGRLMRPDHVLHREPDVD